MKYLVPTTLLIFIFTITAIGVASDPNTGPLPCETPASTLPSMPLKTPEPRNWKGVRILHIGDSHLQNWGLKGTLRKKFEAAGAVYNVAAWKGSSSRTWLRTGKLHRLLQEKNPQVVIVNLGTNVSRARHPEDYAKFIKKMIERIAPRQCYWVSPPPLIKDTNGFYDMLISATGNCRFLDSRKIPFDVTPKKYFHLNREQSTVWAEYIWEWMNDPSNIPENTDGI